MINADDVDIKADKNSDAYILALTAKHLPGSWLPYGARNDHKKCRTFFQGNLY